MAETAKIVTEEEVRCVADRLARAYPYIEERKRKEGVLDDPPLDALVRAILSQNTNDANRDKAFNTLRGRYPTWSAVMIAPTEEVADAIHAVNYAYTKAGRIQAILQELQQEHGALTLDFLRDWETEPLLTYLRHFPGVGAKSAAIVALFSLKRPVVPVDTHVYRVSQRLGWLGPKVNEEKAHAVLRQLIPPELMFPLHAGMWEHGRITCRPVPKCARCSIYEFCLFPAKTSPQSSPDEAIAATSGGNV